MYYCVLNCRISALDCGEEAACWMSEFLQKNCRLIEHYKQDGRTCKLQGTGLNFFICSFEQNVYNLVNKSLAGRCHSILSTILSIIRMSVCVLHVRANFYICLPFVRKLPKDLFTITVVPCIIILNHFKPLLPLSCYHFLVHINLIYQYIF